MEKEIEKEIVTFAKQQFAFLKTEKGFIKPLINRPDYALLIYRSATMEIRIEMHLWVSGMEIVIRRLGSDGKPARESGRHTCWLLESLLTRLLHVQDEHILTLDQIRLEIRKDKWHKVRWEKSQWMQVIGLYQALLRDHIDLILQQPLDVLFPTGAPYVGSTEEWERLLDDHFAFLEEYGFGPHPVYAVESWLGLYTWMSVDRGIQFILDSRDIGPYCYVIKLIDGKIPTTDDKMVQTYAHFIWGEEAKVRLVDLLSEQLGITDTDIERVRNLNRILNIRHWSDCDYSYYSNYAIEYAKLVRRYIKVLMQAPLETLFASVR
jgi:hypothetical protein